MVTLDGNIPKGNLLLFRGHVDKDGTAEGEMNFATDDTGALGRRRSKLGNFQVGG